MENSDKQEAFTRELGNAFLEFRLNQSPEALRSLIEDKQSHGHELVNSLFTHSPVVCQFLDAYVEKTRPNRVLDSYFSLNSPLLNHKFEVAQYLEPLNSEDGLIRELLKRAEGEKLDLKYSNSVTEVTEVYSEVTQQYDLIYHSPPLGVRLEGQSQTKNHRLLRDWTVLGIAGLAKNLSPDGVMISVVTMPFTSQASLYDVLSKNGVEVKAIYNYRNSQSWPYPLGGYGSLGVCVLVLGKGVQKEFYADTIDDRKSLEGSFGAWNKDVESGRRQRARGIWVAPDDWRGSVEHAQLRARLTKTMKRRGLQKMNVSEVFDVSIIKNGERKENEKPSVFVPFLNSKKASCDYFPQRARGVELSPKGDFSFIQAQVLAGWMNSELGILWRKVFFYHPNTKVPSSLSGLKFEEWEIPTFDDNLASRIGDALKRKEVLEEKLLSLGEDIWRGDSEPFNVLSSLSDSIDVKSLPERLPWPLSSSLRGAFNAQNPKDKAERLNYFFEAVSVFMPVVLLTLVFRDEELKKGFAAHWQSNLSKNEGVNFERTTMGNWQELLTSSASYIRGERDNGGDNEGSEEEKFYRRIGGIDSAMFDFLTSKKLSGVIKDALSERNNRAHWGNLALAEFEAIAVSLTSCLKIFDSLVGHKFSELSLVSPVNGTMTALEDGGCKVQVDFLRGVSREFERSEIYSDRILYSQQVYLWSRDSFIATEVLPFFHITDDRICYFYNKCEGDDYLFVSYQDKTETSRNMVRDGKRRAELEGIRSIFGF